MTSPSVTSPARFSGATILGLTALGVLLVLGMVWLAGPDGRGETLSWLSGIGALAASAFAGLAVRQNTALAGAVDTVRTQTNGSLDKRIRAAVDSAIVQTLAAVNTPAPAPVAQSDPSTVAPTGADVGQG